MPGPTREYQFVTGIETSTQPTATATPSDDNDLVTKQFLDASETHTFKAFGDINFTAERLDGYHISDSSKNLERVRVFTRNATSTGTLTLRYQVNDTGSQTDNVSLTAGSSASAEITLGTPESLTAGDRLSIDITAIDGTVSDLFIVCYFG